MNKNPLLIQQGTSRIQVLDIISNKIKQDNLSNTKKSKAFSFWQLPVVDKEGVVVDLILFSDYKIPWAKLYTDHEEEINISETIKSTWWGMGPKVKEFENLLSDYLGVKHAIAVNSGTAALDVAQKLLE